MKQFSQREIREAIAHSLGGGQALHVHRLLGSRPHPLFAKEVMEGRAIAHLYDQDIGRLHATVRKLGVRVVLVEYKGQPSQHVDLCCKPLARAIELCNRPTQLAFFDTAGGVGIYDEDES